MQPRDDFMRVVDRCNKKRIPFADLKFIERSMLVAY